MLQSEGDWSSHTLRLLGVLGAASNVESLYEQKSAMAGLVLKRLDARPVNHEVVHLVGYLGDSLLDEGLVKKWLEPNIGVLLDVAFATLASSASSSAVSQAWLNVFMCTVTSPRLLEVRSSCYVEIFISQLKCLWRRRCRRFLGESYRSWKYTNRSSLVLL